MLALRIRSCAWSTVIPVSFGSCPTARPSETVIVTSVPLRTRLPDDGSVLSTSPRRPCRSTRARPSSRPARRPRAAAEPARGRAAGPPAWWCSGRSRSTTHSCRGVLPSCGSSPVSSSDRIDAGGVDVGACVATGRRRRARGRGRDMVPIRTPPVACAPGVGAPTALARPKSATLIQAVVADQHVLRLHVAVARCPAAVRGGERAQTTGSSSDRRLAPWRHRRLASPITSRSVCAGTMLHRPR